MTWRLFFSSFSLEEFDLSLCVLREDQVQWQEFLLDSANFLDLVGSVEDDEVLGLWEARFLFHLFSVDLRW